MWFSGLGHNPTCKDSMKILGSSVINVQKLRRTSRQRRGQQPGRGQLRQMGYVLFVAVLTNGVGSCGAVSAAAASSYAPALSPCRWCCYGRRCWSCSCWCGCRCHDGCDVCGCCCCCPQSRVFCSQCGRCCCSCCCFRCGFCCACPCCRRCS